MRKSELLMLCVLTVLLGSCSLGQDEKDTVVKVDPEFRVSMFEELGKIRNFHLEVETYENATCENSTIQFAANRDGSVIHLDVLGIEQPTDCIAGNAPAQTSIPYGFLGNGTYPIELTIKQAILTTGQLSVTDESYSIALDSDDGFVLGKEEIRRVPVNFVWGYVAYKTEEHASTANSFLTEITDWLSTRHILTGDYGYFLMDDAMQLKLVETPDGFTYFTTFYGAASRDIGEVMQLLEDYRSSYPSSEFEFKVFTWEGIAL